MKKRIHDLENNKIDNNNKLETTTRTSKNPKIVWTEYKGSDEKDSRLRQRKR